MKHFWQEQGEKIRTILICSAIFLVMLSAIALLSSAVMRLFGFTYRSVGSIIPDCHGAVLSALSGGRGAAKGTV